MKIKFFTIVLTFSAFFHGVVFSQQRGVEIKLKKADGQTQNVWLYQGSYALIIGNSEYSNGWDRLSGVKSDVIAVKNVLETHGFKVEIEENLTSERFETRIRKFINDYGFDRDNRLIIYYAGHGYTLNSAGDKRELGYIIPSDTPLPTKDERGFRQKAVDMYAINTFAKQIQAKHALFIFDSCFSGKMFALRNTLTISPFIYDKVDNPVRQFITAGDETQTVPDESIFRKAFVRGLEGEADRNNDTFITGTELADYLKEAVTNYSNRRQTPQYGLINDIDLDRGDFVFVIQQRIAPILSIPITEKNRLASEALAQKALAKMKSAELEEAFELASQAIALNPTQAMAFAVRGYTGKWLSADLNGWKLAKKDLLDAVSLEPDNKVFTALKSDVSDDDRDERKIAVRNLKSPNTALEFFAKNVAQLWSNEWDNNENNLYKNFDKAIRLETNFTLAYFMRGMLKAEGPNDPQGSYDDMTFVINKLPNKGYIKGVAYWIRGQMIQDLKKSELDAIKDYSKAIENLATYKTDAYLKVAIENRAASYLKLGRYDEALADRTVLINLDKSIAFNYQERANVYMAKGDYNSAVSDYTKAIIIILGDNPNSMGLFGLYNFRATAYEKAGNFQKAVIDKQNAEEIERLNQKK